MDKKINIIIAGGGTGGHLIPAFALADAFARKKTCSKIRFMGSENGIESSLYKTRPEKYDLLKTVGLKRGFGLKELVHNLFFFPYKFIHSAIKAYMVFNKFRPDIVIGTGGYSSAIPLFIALLKGVKIVIQEQNSIPGLVNKIFIKKAEKVFFGFEPKESENINYIVSGNPTISKKYDASAESVKKDSMPFTIFILGGSQGSLPINNHFLNHYKDYVKNGIRLIWQCGENNLQLIKQQIQSKYVELYGFIDEIGKYYIDSDLIISRSGALTLTEISNYGKASILIPYPFASNNHQLSNANFYKSRGACDIVEQNQLKNGLLEKKVQDIINNRLIIEKMEKKMSLLSKPNASENIVKEIFKICSIKAK